MQGGEDEQTVAFTRSASHIVAGSTLGRSRHSCVVDRVNAFTTFRDSLGCSPGRAFKGLLVGCIFANMPLPYTALMAYLSMKGSK